MLIKCAGSACTAPPLMLAGFAPVLQMPAALQCVPHLLAEAASWWAVTQLAQRAAPGVVPLASNQRQAQRHVGAPDRAACRSVAASTALQLMAWNPLMLATAASKSSAVFSNAAVLCALLAATRLQLMRCAMLCALAAYIRPHNLLFAVPLCLLLVQGCEQLAVQPSAAARSSAETPTPVDCKPGKTVESSLQHLLHCQAPASASQSCMTALRFAGGMLFAAALLAALSELALQCLHCRSGAGCLHAAQQYLQGRHAAHSLAAWLTHMVSPRQWAAAAMPPWPWGAYGGVWQYSDLRVNIGLWWRVRLCRQHSACRQQARCTACTRWHLRGICLTVPHALRYVGCG